MRKKRKHRNSLQPNLNHLLLSSSFIGVAFGFHYSLSLSTLYSLLSLSHRAYNNEYVCFVRLSFIFLIVREQKDQSSSLFCLGFLFHIIILASIIISFTFFTSLPQLLALFEADSKDKTISFNLLLFLVWYYCTSNNILYKDITWIDGRNH
jgi:hypothetical protein